MTDARDKTTRSNGTGSNGNAGPADPFAGLTIDFGGGAESPPADGPISFGSPIAFDAPPAAVQLPRSSRPARGPPGSEAGGGSDEHRTKVRSVGPGPAGLPPAI